MSNTTIDVSAIEALGYTVEICTEDPNSPLSAAYVLRGKRGAEYHLVRNKPNPEMLFPVKWKGWTAGFKVAGYSWFTDRGGRLRGC